MRGKIKNIVEKEYHGDYGEAVRNLIKVEHELKLEQAKKLLKDNGNKIPYHRWYKNEQYNYEAYGINKGKTTGYFKVESNRYSGNRKMVVFYRCYEIGVMVYINLTMCKMGIAQGISSPFKLQSSNKREFDTAYKKIMKMLN